MPKPSLEPAVERLVGSLIYQLPFAGQELIDLRIELADMADRLEREKPLSPQQLNQIISLYDRLGEQFDLPLYERLKHPNGTTFI